MKNCAKCNIEKPLIAFSKSSKGAGGLRSNCKSCDAVYRAENKSRIRSYLDENYHRYREAKRAYDVKYRELNRDSLIARSARYHAENKEAIRIQRLAYRAGKKKEKRDYDASYRKANSELLRKKKSAYRAENPEKIAERGRNRRAMELGAEGNHTAADIRRIFDHQRGMCANCKVKLKKSGKQKFHVDHIVALSRGGSNWPSNLQCLCPFCNISKHAKDPISWAQENGRLI